MNISKKSGKKVIIIGLDGATFDLIKPWAKEGKLPTFKRLIEEGVHGELTSTIPYATIPAWPSFATGCNPGKHGFYDFFKQKYNSYELSVEMQPSRAVKQPTLWQILSQYNRTVAVINVPSTYPPTKINGYMITGMLTPPKARYTYPPEFEVELKKKIGEYNIFFSSLSAKNPDVLIKDLEKTLEQRIKATQYLWIDKQPDFLMVVDNGTDRAEHELWRFLDPLNPLYKTNEVKRYENPLLRYYQIVDRALQKIIDLLDEDTVLIIMSDHGQGPLRKFVNLNLFLIEEGFMRIKKGIVSKLRYFLFNHGFTPHNLYNFLKKLGIERYASDRVSQQTRLFLLNKFFFSTSDIDWSKTKAFASGVTGGITINMEGRQPKGIVKPGKEYEDLREELADKLKQLVDPDTGDKIVANVYKREEIYQGPYLSEAPDLIVTPNEGYEFFGMFGFSFNKVIEPTFGNSGAHRPNGLFMAIGKGIKKGFEIKGPTIIDIAPTVLHIFDVPVLTNMDGKVLLEIFEENSDLAKKSVKYQESNHEKKKIKEMIKKLRI
jgi:predicted AlkP superfamily phosphohydrolase/phosphomutase